MTDAWWNVIVCVGNIVALFGVTLSIVGLYERSKRKKK
jgi:hypothetical protein